MTAPLSAEQSALYARVPHDFALLPATVDQADETLASLIARGLVEIVYVGWRSAGARTAVDVGWNWRKIFWRQLPAPSRISALPGRGAGIAASQDAAA